MLKPLRFDLDRVKMFEMDIYVVWDIWEFCWDLIRSPISLSESRMVSLYIGTSLEDLILGVADAD